MIVVSLGTAISIMFATYLLCFVGVAGYCSVAKVR